MLQLSVDIQFRMLEIMEQWLHATMRVAKLKPAVGQQDV
jgi:hypothetical protein